MKTYPHSSISPLYPQAKQMGLTKREYFASQALVAFIPNRTPDTAAVRAVEYADKLIQELNRNED